MRNRHPLQGKKILITGGNAGIGRATALRLARKGALLVLACRRLERGEKAAARIRRQTGNEAVTAIQCDLADLNSVRAAATMVQERWPTLDILINNAGLFSTSLRLTEQGYEKQFGVNHLGHFLLTYLLLDHLHAAPAARIINVTSVAHFKGQIDWQNLRGERGPSDYHGLQAYAQSKLCNVLFTMEMARRYPAITSNCLHPGVVRTDFASKDVVWYYRLFWRLWKPFMHSPNRGACTSIYLAASPEVREVTGRYFDDRQCPRKPAPLGRDPELADQLWTYSLRACGVPDHSA